MQIPDNRSVEADSVQARVIVSLTYVQALLREFEAGQLDSATLENYLVRIECHLHQIECSSAIFHDNGADQRDAGAHYVVEDILISERVTQS